MKKFEFTDKFINRHIGPDDNEIGQMLKEIGVAGMDELVSKTIPANIRTGNEPELPEPLTEYEIINELRALASKNKIFKSYIGMGYYDAVTPAVIIRNILENPGWYTQYTPYQSEISQGRMEALLNFQTMVCDLTGLPLANASLLDEATAAAEAMAMFHNARRGAKKNANVFLASKNIFPQTLDVLTGRAEPKGIEVRIVDENDFELTDDVFGLLVQYPDGNGEIHDYKQLFERAAEKGIFKAVATDLMSLTLLTPPGEFGADAALGSTQRFGLPLSYGGPHAAFFATTENFKRLIPGRIIGVSVDSRNRFAYRMALQTREQHIKRERATSNICTAQVLLAIMSSMYAVYHGAEGLTKIAKRINLLANYLDKSLKSLEFNQLNKSYFDTLRIRFEKTEEVERLKNEALKREINFRYFDDKTVGVSINETTTEPDVDEIIDLFAGIKSKSIDVNSRNKLKEEAGVFLPDGLRRQSKFLTHPVFNKYHTETEMMRYIKNLERKDLSLTTSMIPLGSCTMKLNAAVELFALSWKEFGAIHPFAPPEQAHGYQTVIERLEKYLAEITGFDAVTLQPNSGAQGEFTGLMIIRKYHVTNGQPQRNVILIPSSAHGTNPASAVMAGNKVVIVRCDENGNIDLEDLRNKAEEHKENLAGFMVTYPSTHGIFEEDIKEMTDIIHRYGGLVYMDGANMNAQLGLTTPKDIGADVCHLNLHKTFAIPHGGGGPGVGPVAVTRKLAGFLPGHPVININKGNSIHAVSAAPWGSAHILLISYAFIRMIGAEGLKKVAQVSILNANYIKARLEKYFKVLYKGKNGFVGHELIFDTREFKQSAAVDVIDIAKRMMDYGFHAPTVSFPVPGTLMVEPTESESKYELDRFCEMMISIWNEIQEIANGTVGKEDNVLVNSPHTAIDIVDEWHHPYSREKAVFPVDWCKDNKFWPPINRIDDAYGDRHLVCSCLPVEEYETENV